MGAMRTWGVILAAILGSFAIVLAVLVLWPDGRDDDDAAMGGMTTGDAETIIVPPVTGFYDGDEISFIHTEASDPQVVEMLTGMMESPVILVPALASVPDAALATVFVFTNGVVPDGAQGPFGFQPDVFDSAPGDDGYSPLRSINLVTWTDEASATLLQSAQDVIEAEQQGRVTIEQSGIVANMPFLTWPSGQR